MMSVPKCILLVCTLIVYVSAISSKNDYVADQSTNFANPYRGFYVVEETKTSSWSSIDASSVATRLSDISGSVLQRNVYMDSYLNRDLDETFINNHALDFTTVRDQLPGVKLLIRYGYVANQTAPQAQPTQTQILQHISQLSTLWGNYSDVIDVVQAGFIGVWGEWYYVQPASQGWGTYPFNATQRQQRRNIVDALLAALPEPITLALRSPYYKKSMFEYSTPNTALTGVLSRVSYFDDCFLADDTDSGTWFSQADYDFFIKETESVSLTGESCAVSSYSDCAGVTNKLPAMHWTTLNHVYHPSVVSSWQSGGCYDWVARSLGYRLRFTSASIPATVVGGASTTLSLTLVNDGVAAPPVSFGVQVLGHTSGGSITVMSANSVNTRSWRFFNGSSAPVDIPFTVPASLVGQEISLSLRLVDPNPSLQSNPKYNVRFANDGVWEPSKGTNLLGISTKVSTSSTDDDTTSKGIRISSALLALL